jgi:hypothetical protein
LLALQYHPQIITPKLCVLVRGLGLRQIATSAVLLLTAQHRTAIFDIYGIVMLPVFDVCIVGLIFLYVDITRMRRTICFVVIELEISDSAWCRPE